MEEHRRVVLKLIDTIDVSITTAQKLGGKLGELLRATRQDGQLFFRVNPRTIVEVAMHEPIIDRQLAAYLDSRHIAFENCKIWRIQLGAARYACKSKLAILDDIELGETEARQTRLKDATADVERDMVEAEKARGTFSASLRRDEVEQIRLEGEIMAIKARMRSH